MSWVRVWVDLDLFATHFPDKVLKKVKKNLVSQVFPKRDIWRFFLSNVQSGSRRGSSRRVGDNTATTNSSSASSPNGGSGGQSAGGGGATGRGPVPSSTSSSQATTPDEVVGDFLNQVCIKLISEFRLLDFYFVLFCTGVLLLKTELLRPQLRQPAVDYLSFSSHQWTVQQ